MNIALDVMGGDHGPGEIVAGAVEAARAYKFTVSLVGKPDLEKNCTASPPETTPSLSASASTNHWL